MDIITVIFLNTIHLPVTEAKLGIHHGGPFVYDDASGNRHWLVQRPATVLEAVREIPVQVATIRFVPADEVVKPLL